MQVKFQETQIVIQRKLVIIPYLNDQSRWEPKFSLVNTPEMLFFSNDTELFSWEVVKWEDKSPVKIPFSI